MALRRAWDSDDTLLAAGFSLARGEDGEPDEMGFCPHCQGEITGMADVTIQGDSVLCNKCGKGVLNTPAGVDNDTTQEDDEEINREEFIAAWGEQFDPEEGDMDYE